MKHKLRLSAGLLLAASLVSRAHASTFDFTFAGGGVSGTVDLTYGPSTDAKYSQGFEVTAISGTFSDSNIGINNVAIGSLVPLTYSTPEPGNNLAPHDFSRFSVAKGLPPVSNGFITYDNLLYPNGSPATATNYPAAGGFLDIYGLLFNIGGGDVVDLWSNGTFVPGAPVDYGVAVATSATALDYVAGNVAVSPEPSVFALFGTGLLGMLVWRRRGSR